MVYLANFLSVEMSLFCGALFAYNSHIEYVMGIETVRST